jgi:hypothetical protein
VKSKLTSRSNPRTSAGAYESTTPFPATRRGFLDPDEAWDTRVGNEADYTAPSGPGGAYYEETEMGGLRDPGSGPYGGGGYGEERGRTRSKQRELDDRYDEEMGRKDPFGDGAERSDLRGVSPRPVENHDRRSAFREDM